MWEGIILQAALTEPCIQYACLAVGALSRSIHYADAAYHVFALEYSIKKYNLAIQALKISMEHSRNLELAALGSLLFIAIEVLHGNDNRVGMILQTSQSLFRSTPGDGIGGLAYLSRAFSCIEAQVSAFQDLEGHGRLSMATA
jgi:hypothetical protein